MKEPEYTEGPEALQNFKNLATAILQAPRKKQKKQAERASLKGFSIFAGASLI